MKTIRKILEFTRSGGSSKDKLRRELATYKHAFETTAADRDRLANELRACKLALEATRSGRGKSGDPVILSEQEFLSLVDPLDAGFLRVDFERLVAPNNEERANELAKQWLHMSDQKRYHELLDSMFMGAGLRFAFPPTGEHVEHFTDYLLACFLVRLQAFDQAKTFVDRIAFDASIDASDMLPYDIKQSSRFAHARQREALRHSRPGAVLVSLTKSASAYLTHAVSEIFEIPVLRISIGDARRSLVVPRWANQLAGGGAVTHEHLQATPPNLDALANSKLEKIWIQVRDPRDVAFSLKNMRQDFKSIQPAAMRTTPEEEQFLLDLRFAATWVADWLNAARAPSFPRIDFITFGEVTQDLPCTLQRMFGRHFDDKAQARTNEFMYGTSPEGHRPNFRAGVGREWHKLYSAAILEQAWQEIPRDVKELLRLER